jgi:hypothetical protein
MDNRIVNRPKSRAWWIVALGSLAGLGLISVLVLAVVASRLPGGLVSLFRPAAESTPIPDFAGSGTLGGVVWHDVCVGEGSEPQTGCVLVPVSLRSRADAIFTPDEAGIMGVAVRLGSGVCPSFGLASTTTSADGSFSFSDLSAGRYCVSVNAQDVENEAELLPGEWTFPNALGNAASVTVDLAGGEGLPAVNFGWDYALLPESSIPLTGLPTPTPFVTPTTVAASCQDRATFVADLTIADNTILPPGQTFDKTWRLRNSGTCVWNGTYSLIFFSGHSLGGPASQALTQTIDPGATVDITVPLAAPASNGAYRGSWILRNDAGTSFGVGESANKPVWVQIIVSPAGQTVSGTWRGEYFSNRELKGTPALIRQDAVIDFDWRREGPAAGVPADNFSVRWTGKIDLDAGTYRFNALADDGVRLWVDEILVIDAWKDSAIRELTGELSLARGEHNVRLEYYDRSNDARVRLLWEKITSPSYPDWKAEYFDNRTLSGTPALVRNDRSINFDWAANAPAVGIPSNNYSVRWTRTVDFGSGNSNYRFTANSDDGLRIFVDGKLILDEWHNSSGSTIYSVDRKFSGSRVVTVEYFENTGNAKVKVRWERFTLPPTPAPTLIPTVTDEPGVTPEPSHTPVPSETPVAGDGSGYDFASQACLAQWTSSSADLVCPGSESDAEGYVIVLDSVTLEGGLALSGPTLQMHPSNVTDGWIKGVFPGVTIEDGDSFLATIGCLDEAVNCAVDFVLEYSINDGPIKTIGNWAQRHNNLVGEIDIDLSLLAGKTVSFIFTILADGEADQDLAAWFGPRILR